MFGKLGNKSDPLPESKHVPIMLDCERSSKFDRAAQYCELTNWRNRC